MVADTGIVVDGRRQDRLQSTSFKLGTVADSVPTALVPIHSLEVILDITNFCRYYLLRPVQIRGAKQIYVITNRV